MTAATPAADWEVLPAEGQDLQAVAQQCRKMVRKRALVAAGVAMVPLLAMMLATLHYFFRQQEAAEAARQRERGRAARAQPRDRRPPHSTSPRQAGR